MVNWHKFFTSILDTISDGVFISDANEASDENHGMTLNEARENYRKIGACSPDMLRHVRKPQPEEIPK